MRVVLQGGKEEVNRLGLLALRGDMPSERRPGAPFPRCLGRKAPAQLHEAGVGAERAVALLEPLEREVGAFRRDVYGALPYRDGSDQVSLLVSDVAQVQVGGRHGRVELDGGREPTRRLGEVPLLHGLESDLVLEEGKNRLGLGLFWRTGDLGETLPRDVGLLPLVLVFLEFLEIGEGGLVRGVEL